MKPDVLRDLEMLAERLEHLRTLLAWRRLREQEQPIERLGRRRPDPSPGEIGFAYGSFIDLASDIQDALDQCSTTSRQRIEWKDELRALLLDFTALQVPESYIKP